MFTLLSDKTVQHLLTNLSTTELETLTQVLSQSLIQYSTQNEQQYQPHRAAVTRSTGQTTLFMPATTESLVGVKIVGVAPSSPFPDPTTTSAPSTNTKPQSGLKSALTLCDAQGQALGILNAAELTAFRTSLGSMLLYKARRNTANIVVFGAGKQALWHIRLAVLLRSKDIRRITIVNRSRQRSEELIATLTGKADTGAAWPSHITLEAFEQQEKQEVEARIVDSDVVFCTTPSKAPLFPASLLTAEQARKKTRYISAIGSYKLDMAELDPELLREVANSSGVFASQVWQGTITVDSREGCLHEAGELVSSGVPPEKWMEVGAIKNESSAEMDRWLEDGFVIYKSVGVGIMDLAIGRALLDLAQAKGVGSTVDDF